MWYFNGTIKTPKVMVINDITYPKTIFKDSDALASLGIKPYREVRPDSRYYHDGAFTLDESGAEVVGTYSGIARDVDTLKAGMLDTFNSQVASKQGAIDWYWARAEKGGKAVPLDIASYATTIYTEQATKEGEVNALTTLDDIIEYTNRAFTEVLKVSNADGTYGPKTLSNAVTVDMLKHWTSNPNKEIHPSFVSLTED